MRPAAAWVAGPGWPCVVRRGRRDVPSLWARGGCAGRPSALHDAPASLEAHRRRDHEQSVRGVWLAVPVGPVRRQWTRSRRQWTRSRQPVLSGRPAYFVWHALLAKWAKTANKPCSCLTSAGSSSACAPASGEAAFIALLQAHRLSPRSSNLRLCWRIAGARTRLAVDAQHTLPKLDTSLPDSTTAKAALTTVVFARAPLQDWTEAAASRVGRG